MILTSSYDIYQYTLKAPFFFSKISIRSNFPYVHAYVHYIPPKAFVL